MYVACKKYLIARLAAVGLKNPHTAQKTLERSAEGRLSAVLFDKETLSRNGSKTIYHDKEGARKKRKKQFDREISFTVIIGDYSDESVEALYEQFIGGLDKGFLVDGNFVAITPEETEWVDEEDIILKAKVWVKLSLRFTGGIYRDTSFAKIREMEISEVQKE